MSVVRAVFDYLFSSVAEKTGEIVQQANVAAANAYQQASSLVATPIEERAEKQSEKYKRAVAPILERQAERKAQLAAKAIKNTSEEKQQLDSVKAAIHDIIADLDTQLQASSQSMLSYFNRSAIKTICTERDALLRLITASVYTEMRLIAQQVYATLAENSRQSPAAVIIDKIINTENVVDLKDYFHPARLSASN